VLASSFSLGAAVSNRGYVTTPVQVTAVLVLVGLGLLARLPSSSRQEAKALAERFHFVRAPLPVTDEPFRYQVLDVNHNVTHLRHYLSTLTSSAAFGDLTEDGLPNDVCRTEMRTKQVVVAPVPGTGDRYPPFALDPGALVDAEASYPSKCLIGDLNEDGLADVVVLFVAARPIAFLRRTASEGTGYGKPSASDFAIRELAPGAPFWVNTTGTFADIDGDGHVDLVLGNYFADGDEVFDGSSNAPVSMNDTFSRARNGGVNRILLWQGASVGSEPDVSFREVADPFPNDDERAWTLAIGAADLDRDGLADLYLANDFGPDTLYVNRSTPGQLRLVPLRGRKGFFIPKSRVLGYDSFKSMGVDFADVNGDGFFDMFVSNINKAYGITESHFLWQSTGEIDAIDDGVAPYVDRGEELGVSRSSWGWDSRFADFDNDGVQEAIQATGFMKGTIDRWPLLAELATVNDRLIQDPAVWPFLGDEADVSGHDPNPFYARGKDGRFVEVSGEIDLGGPWNTRAIAIGDVDGDGLLDFAFGNTWEDSQFYRNESPGAGSFLALHVLRPPAGTVRPSSEAGPGHPAEPAHGWPACSAVVTVRLPDGGERIGQVDCGSGHTGSPSPQVHFGLGRLPADAQLAVDVDWRDSSGARRSDHFVFQPGWHTIRLASGEA
jgi:hypothetical protein